MLNIEIKKIVSVFSVLFVISACQPDTGKATETSTQKTTAVKDDKNIKDEDKIGYALGAKMAGFIKTDLDKYQLPKINQDSVAKGFTDTLAGKDKMNEEEIQAQFAIFQQLIQAAQQQEMEVQKQQQAKQGEQALIDGKAFLDANGKKEGVTTTDSGLQYSVITQGKETGAKPTAADTVTVHYTGTFINGEKFDSSVDRGTPASFPLNGVIKGWTEGLQLMTVGSKYHFVIPHELAYGPNGRPGAIPGNSVLEFDVELISIDTKEEKK